MNGASTDHSRDATKYLNPPAELELQRVVDQYALDLLTEAGRLEGAGKSTKGNPELTSTFIKDADLLLRRGYSRRPKTPLLVVSQVVGSVGGFLTGLLADADKLKDPLMLLVFVVLLTVTITATVIAVMKE
jgi:hypothetical protein